MSISTAERPGPVGANSPTGGSQPNRPFKVVLFSGGSGTGTIADALLRHTQLDLTVIINAYDDGHSTGRLRRFIPGLLGPSDVRKNINRLMPQQQDRHTALRFLSDHRLPAKYPFESGMAVTRAFANWQEDGWPAALRSRVELLSVRQARIFQRYFQRFLEYAGNEAAAGRPFDFDDCALGNILFAGCFLDEDRDFNRSVEAFSRFFEIRGRILNVTCGENLFLAARTERGEYIRGEAELVSRENAGRISELYLIDEVIYRDQIEANTHLPDAEIGTFIVSGARIPSLNPEAKEAIETANLIIYGPGTQHSSLLPSYLTAGVAEAITANGHADKVFISNIRRDVDIPFENANELAGKFLRAMSRNGDVAITWNQVVTKFFFQQNDPASEAPQYVPFDQSRFELPLDAVTARDWEAQDGKHAGSYVMKEIRQLLESRLGTVLHSSPQMVSIVVPALNEEATVAETLQRLSALDLSAFEVSKEIIFVDGGSTDRTLEIARGVSGVKTHQLKDAKGRGAALRCGVEKARGDIIVFYPADLEYREQDILSLLFSIIRNGFRVVFGTRAVKCTDLSSRLQDVYGGKGLPYLVSKYGGMLLSTTTLFLYNRYVTDTLTSLKAFDASLLRSLDLQSSGMDLDAEIVAKVCRQGEYILEVPVEYRARTKAEGKKSTTSQGLKTLLALLVWRFAKIHEAPVHHHSRV
jgi:2-phospho-L-lactate transferase/gluconeogenesis factor (CofD/UPF0052 family)